MLAKVAAEKDAKDKADVAESERTAKSTTHVPISKTTELP